MRTRKELKKEARGVVKTHYIFLIIVCIIAINFGIEFSEVKGHAQDLYATVTGQEVQLGGTDFKGDPRKPRLEIFDEILDKGSIKAGSDSARENQEEIIKNADPGAAAGRNRGALASLVNSFTSGTTYVKLVEIIYGITKSEEVAAVILLFLMFLCSLAIAIFVKEVYKSILRRMFLEARTYEVVPVSHMLHFKFVKRWFRAAMTLLLKNVLFSLWCLTIVGGFIKYFSYIMVPYIVAENPSIKPREAIDLSRRIMDGHKWECCKLKLSFIGWYLLGSASFGISEIFWSVAYEEATFAAYYADIRAMAKSQGVEGAEKLNDIYLFEKAPRKRLEWAYDDILEQEAYIEEHAVEVTGFKKFMLDNFSLWIGSTEEKLQYDEVDSYRQQIRERQAIMAGRLYPLRLSPGWHGYGNKAVREVRSLRSYTVWSVIAVFFIFCFVGWAWEVSIHLIEDGIFVNRGTLHGPWLPIYGGGVAGIIVLLARFRSKPLKEMLGILILSGTLEYMTSLLLEMSKGMRWWDYTGYFLNLNGRICAEGLTIFVVGGALAVYLVVPVLDAMLSHAPTKILVPICCILTVIFIADLVYSHYVPNVGAGITDYDAYQEVSVLTPEWAARNPFDPLTGQMICRE